MLYSSWTSLRRFTNIECSSSVLKILCHPAPRFIMCYKAFLNFILGGRGMTCFSESLNHLDKLIIWNPWHLIKRLSFAVMRLGQLRSLKRYVIRMAVPLLPRHSWKKESLCSAARRWQTLKSAKSNTGQYWHLPRSPENLGPSSYNNLDDESPVDYTSS